jgi:hypothetical protein
MTRHLRGSAVCGNRLAVRLDDTDAAVLGAVESQLLRVEVLETALYKALAMLQAPQDDVAAGLRDELVRLDADVARLADAIARGGALESLLGVLQEREQRRAHVRAALAEQERQQVAQRDPGDALAFMRQALTDWQGLLRQETGPARSALQALLAGRLVFTPRTGGLHVRGAGNGCPDHRRSRSKRCRFPDTDDSPRPTAGAAAPGPRLSVSGVRGAVRAGASSPPLGSGRAHHALEPGSPLSAAPPRGARGGL